MNLEQTILHILPKWFIGSWEVNGSEITKWNVDWHTQPTQAELDAAWIEVEAKQALEAAKQAKSEQIAKIASLTDQLNNMAASIEAIVDVLKVTHPDIDFHPAIANWRTVYNQIKTIRNS